MDKPQTNANDVLIAVIKAADERAEKSSKTETYCKSFQAVFDAIWEKVEPLISK